MSTTPKQLTLLGAGFLTCLLLLMNANAQADVPLTDGRLGMTCHFYAATGRLEWRKPGGDWADANGDLFGDRPYSSTSVGTDTVIQRVEFDLSALVADWNAGLQPGAVFLRTGSGRGGIVNFLTRESPDDAVHPTLRLEWDDGDRTVLLPSGDTQLSCPTHRSLGARRYLQIGDRNSAALVFPFEPRLGHEVSRATLTLWSNKQYQGGATIGVYRIAPPFGESPAKPGLADRYARDKGIENDPDVIFAERFDRSDWRSSWADSNLGEPIANGPEDRFAPLDGKALKVTVETGKRLGLNMSFRFDEQGLQEPEEIYFRYYLRFADNWNPTVTGGKLPGIAGTYGRAGWGGRKADGTNGWSARGQFFQVPGSESAFAALRGIGSYVYHIDAGEYGDPLGWNLGPTGMLRKNRWYSIEQYVKLNTPGNADGILRAWVDGRLALERTDLRFRSVPDLKIDRIWMNVYHGGIAKAKHDMSLYIDNVVVARRYIGPLGAAPVTDDAR